MRSGRYFASLTVAAGAVALAATALPAPAGGATPRVLRVGTWKGIAGTYHSIQAAVDAANPGDWVLVGPGDWKEVGDFTTHKPASGEPGWGVTIDKAGLHLRGMNRNSVVVDGTKAGTPQCSANRADQNFGGSRGRSGIVVDKVDGTYVENLTVCNFLGQGNQIWWNGGDGSGKVGMGTYWGNYLTATTTYWGANDPAGTYGIFVSNARGPGSINYTYASNMNDSSYYIGACADCNVVLDHPWAEHSALGYSGTNSGGHLVIQNGKWDDNQSGIVTNSQNNDDAPSPQLGACPASASTSCEFFEHNEIFNNNDPNVPQDTGAASAGPVGTGIVIAGGRFDTVNDNFIHDNGAWGVLTTPYPDSEVPPSGVGQNCNGGFTGTQLTPLVGTTGSVPCYYSDWGNEVAHNTFANNGSFGNPTNGDIADLSTVPPESPTAPANCWHDNTDSGGTLSQWPLTLQTTQATCGGNVYPDPASTAVLTAQALCDTDFLSQASPSAPSCTLPLVASYPKTTTVTLKPLPSGLAPMPNPCAGVPVNPWCPAPKTVEAAHPAAAGRGGTLARTGLDARLPIAAAVLVAAAAGGLVALRRRAGHEEH
jgi:hypothetical protein